MRIRTASDVIATAIAWFPLIALLVGIGWVVAIGVMNLELRTDRTHYLVGTNESSAPDYYANARTGDPATSGF
jgi:hypothetical protein